MYAHSIRLLIFVGSTAEESGLDFRQAKEVFSTASRSCLEPIQPVKWVTIFLERIDGRGLKLTTHLHIMPLLSEAMSSWRDALLRTWTTLPFDLTPNIAFLWLEL
jgi:hypothetical protein